MRTTSRAPRHTFRLYPAYWAAPLALSAALLGTTTTHAQLPPEPSENVEVSDQARELFSVGVALLQDPDGARYEEAFRSFMQAYEASPSWKILGNLGLCALKLERYTDGIEAYERYLEAGADSMDPAERKQVERDLRIMKGTSGTLLIRVKGGTPERIHDSRARTVGGPVTNTYTVGDDEALKLDVAGGTHTVSATSDGKRAEVVVEVEIGAQTEAVLDFSPEAPAPMATTSTAEPTPQNAPPPRDTAQSGATFSTDDAPSGSSLRTVGYIVGGVGVAALIGGAVTTGMGFGLKGDLDGRCPDGRCEYTSAEDKKTFEDDQNQLQTLGTVTTALYIGGGVLAATGVTLWFLGGKNSGENVAMQLSPSLGPDLTGLIAEGRF